MARTDEVKARVTKLIAGFEEYVQAYADNPPFSAEQLRVHRRTVALRQQAGSVRAAVESTAFIESLYLTLRKWRIGQRQSKLVPLDDFKAALRAVLPTMEQLEWVAINADFRAALPAFECSERSSLAREARICPDVGIHRMFSLRRAYGRGCKKLSSAA